MAGSGSNLPRPTSITTDVATLFRTRRVSEIRAIESQLRNEIDQHTTSLRSLLSTRYPDLLKGADTICDIRDIAIKDILETTQSLSTTALKLRERLLLKSTTNNHLEDEKNKKNIEERKTVHVIGSRLKYLVDTPEVLHNLLDSSKIYEATVRYLKCENIYNTLKETGEMYNFINFLKRRLNNIYIFEKQLIAHAETSLQKKDLTFEEYGEIIIANAWIYNRLEKKIERKKEDFESILNVFEKFLVAHNHYIVQLLEQHVQIDNNNDNDFDDDGFKLIKKMEEIIKHVISIITLSFQLFQPSNGIIENLLKNSDLSDDIILGIPSLNIIGESIISWLSVLKLKVLPNNRGSHEETNILSQAHSCSTLSACYQSIQKVCSSASWGDAKSNNDEDSTILKFEIDEKQNETENSFNVPISSVQNIFTASMESQALFLIKKQMEKTSKNFLELMQNTRDSMENKEKKKKSRMGQTLQAHNSDEELIKILGLNNDMDGSIPDSGASHVVESFLKEVSLLLQDVVELSKLLPKVNTLFREELAVCLDSVVAYLVQRSDLSPSAALASAKVACGLAESATLKSAYFVGEEVSSRSSGDQSPEEERYDDVCNSLFQTADKRYRTWANGIVQELKEDLETTLASHLIAVEHGWDLNKDAGSVHVPAAGSAAVMNFILQGCAACEKAQDLDVSNGRSRAATAINAAMADLFCEVYTQELRRIQECDRVDGEKTKSSLEMSSSGQGKGIRLMQMLFDVRMMRAAMLATNVEASLSLKIGSEEQTQRQATFDGLERKLRSCLDPVDFAAGDKKIQKNVDLFLQRSFLLFGMIGNSNNGAQGTVNASGDAMVLRKVVPRFAYLPAPLPSTYVTKVRVGKEQKKNIAKVVDQPTDVGAYAQKITEGIFGSKLFNSIARVGQ